MKTNKQIKREATQAEHHRVYDNYGIPCNIIAYCSDGVYIRDVVPAVGHIAWGRWTKVN